jgi:hypothetical protein
MSRAVTPPDLVGWFRITRWRPTPSPTAKRLAAYLESRGIQTQFVFAGKSVALYRAGVEALAEGVAGNQRRARTGTTD